MAKSPISTRRRIYSFICFVVVWYIMAVIGSELLKIEEFNYIMLWGVITAFVSSIFEKIALNG